MKHRTLIGRAGVRCADGRRARLDYYLLCSSVRCAVRDVLEELLSR